MPTWYGTWWVELGGCRLGGCGLGGNKIERCNEAAMKLSATMNKGGFEASVSRNRVSCGEVRKPESMLVYAVYIHFDDKLVQ